MRKILKKSLKNVRFQKFKVLVCLLFALQTALLFAQGISVKKTVLFDLGHGGHDSGALGLYGLQEKEVLLQLGKELLKVHRLLFEDTFEVFLTRYEDRFVSLADRGRLAKALNVDYVLSLHCNAAQTQAAGLEVFVHPQDLGSSDALALAILNESASALGFVNRGVKTANFQVLRDTHTSCPVVLIELGFITNPDEAAYLLKSQNLRALSLSIFMGLYHLNRQKP